MWEGGNYDKLQDKSWRLVVWALLRRYRTLKAIYHISLYLSATYIIIQVKIVARKFLSVSAGGFPRPNESPSFTSRTFAPRWFPSFVSALFLFFHWDLEHRSRLERQQSSRIYSPYVTASQVSTSLKRGISFNCHPPKQEYTF